MSELEDRFEMATSQVQELPERPGNEVLLRLYALYKQATVGDVEGGSPGFFDLKARMKHDAWEKLRGMEREDAMHSYVELVESLRSP